MATREAYMINVMAEGYLGRYDEFTTKTHLKQEVDYSRCDTL